MSRRTYFIAGRTVGLAHEVAGDDRLRYENWLDPAVQRGYNYRPRWHTFEEFCAFFRNPERPPHRFVATVVRLVDERPIGTVSLAPEYREPDLSIAIYRGSRRSGYGSEAFGLAVDYVFRNLQLDEIVASAREDNLRSIRMLEHCGFKREASEDEIVDDEFGGGKVKWLAFSLARSSWKCRADSPANAADRD